MINSRVLKVSSRSAAFYMSFLRKTERGPFDPHPHPLNGRGLKNYQDLFIGDRILQYNKSEIQRLSHPRNVTEPPPRPPCSRTSPGGPTRYVQSWAKGRGAGWGRVSWMDHVQKSVANLLMVDLAWSFLAIFLYLYVFKMDSVFRGCLKRSFSNEHNSSVSPRIPIEFGYTIKYRLSSHMPLQLFPNLSDNYAKMCCKHDAGFRRFQHSRDRHCVCPL